jgi:hypothetical protein
METTFVALVAYAVFGLTAWLSIGVLFAMQDGLEKLSAAQLQALVTQGRWYGFGMIFACPATIGVLWIAIRMAGREFTEYLALNWPGRRPAARFSGRGYSSGGRVCGFVKRVIRQSDCRGRRIWWRARAVDRRLHRGPDHGRICFPRLYVSRLVGIVPWADRSHRADVGDLGGVPYAIRLVAALLDIRFRNGPLHFSLAH